MLMAHFPFPVSNDFLKFLQQHEKGIWTQRPRFDRLGDRPGDVGPGPEIGVAREEDVVPARDARAEQPW